MESDRLLDVAEVGERLRLSRTAVYGLLAPNGKLPSLSLGRSRRVRLSDLDRFIREEAERQGISGGGAAVAR